MHGRVLIADDRFASRLMLSALFSGAYYDVLQVETADGALEVARRDRPGLIVISDRLPGRGAAGLCEALRHDPATAETARIVMTDLPDPARTAMLIHAGAEEVIARSCRDDEVLARVRKLVDHRARLSALNLRDGPQGTQPGLREPAAEFGRMAQIALIAAAETAEQWASQIRGAADPGLQLRLTCLPPETTASAGGDVVIVDSRTLGTDGTLRVVARMARRSDPARGQILVAIPEEDAALGVRALDLGADSVMTLPLHPAEAVARITLLLRRKAEFTSLHARLRSGLRSAVTDPLTGLYNRRYVLPRLDEVMRDLSGDQRAAAVIMADLDHFKWINDTYGHPAGDAVLAAVARSLKRAVMPPGFAARMGGEEFLVALPRCTADDALTVARRIGAAVAATRVAFPGAPEEVRVTTSVGVALTDASQLSPQRSPSEETAALMARADRALYRAKQAGRNRVVSDLGHLNLAPEVPPRMVSGMGG
ncbi:diguanylate cyclase [Pseudooceanicola sp.]